MAHSERKLEFWSVPVSELLKELEATIEGLKSTESSERLKKYGANILKPKKNQILLKFCFPSSKARLPLFFFLQQE